MKKQMAEKKYITLCNQCPYSSWGYNGLGMRTMWCGNHKKNVGHSPVMFGFADLFKEGFPVAIPGWCKLVTKHKNPMVTYLVVFPENPRNWLNQFANKKLN